MNGWVTFYIVYAACGGGAVTWHFWMLRRSVDYRKRIELAETVGSGPSAPVMLFIFWPLVVIMHVIWRGDGFDE